MLRTQEHILAPIIIGLDTEQVPVRLVQAATNGEPTPNPQERRCFESLDQFRAYWTTHWAGVRGVHVGAPRIGKDPLGILRWLKLADIAVERYPCLDYRVHLHGEFSALELPSVYERAYVLALYASYRLNAAQVVRGMWARVFEMQDLFEDFQIELRRLNAALPAHQEED